MRPREKRTGERFARDLALVMRCFVPFCDWPRKHALLSQPIRGKSKTNSDLVARALGSVLASTFGFVRSIDWLLLSFLFWSAIVYGLNAGGINKSDKMLVSSLKILTS